MHSESASLREELAQKEEEIQKYAQLLDSLQAEIEEHYKVKCAQRGEGGGKGKGGIWEKKGLGGVVAERAFLLFSFFACAFLVFCILFLRFYLNIWVLLLLAFINYCFFFFFEPPGE